MTCIVAVRDAEGITVGADRQGTAGWLVHLSAHPKIIEVADGVIVGTAGSIRIAQVIRYELDWSDLATCLRVFNEDPHTWAVSRLIPALRRCLGEHGALRVDDGVASAHHSAALIVAGGRMLVVESDLQVYESAEEYAAIGSGEAYALGSLWTSSARPRRARAEAALEAAARFDIGVGAPFDYLDCKIFPTP